ncbi:sigma-70 family RNA polymerase sigma factor [Pseudoflavitalea sp. X16]|uniref:RNA polymerase sigma factor n=1 Tax=Paraflavitalea devenefica TaxID=2716334 RepID=UPI001423FAD8|nr:sigma-70 family RNA polymerase sigma factor [Paraflavitalea devenefica]NII26222.1 sigma-70 family RNA polymerase sigma factor [Paraflavitalea devenefica]
MKPGSIIASPDLSFTLDEFKTGGDRVYHLLHKQFNSFLQIFTFKIVKETAAANDLASESILSLWRNRSNIQNLDHLRNSLLKIAYHKSLDYKKASTRRIEREYNYSNQFSINEAGPLDSMIRDEAINDLIGKIDSLPAQWRNVVRMAYIDGMKNKEIAEQLKISINTVKFYKYNGMQELRALYGIDPKFLYPLLFIKQIIRFIFSFL